MQETMFILVAQLVEDIKGVLFKAHSVVRLGLLYVGLDSRVDPAHLVEAARPFRLPITFGGGKLGSIAEIGNSHPSGTGPFLALSW
jgi:hypothetical protein